MSEGKFPWSFHPWFWGRLNAFLCDCALHEKTLARMSKTEKQRFADIAADPVLVQKLQELTPDWDEDD